MRIAGVVAEYNPFHDGHVYHLRRTKQTAADAVVVVMSGNYVQRGEPAVLPKFARAKAAVQCGADLVVELPVPWAIGRAQTFADGAISVFQQLGCVDRLSFGSECGDVGRIRRAASAAHSDETLALTNQLLSAGSITFAAARQQAVRQLFGNDVAEVFNGPNDTLACAYADAARRSSWAADLLAVPRIGAHDGTYCDGENYASSSLIRSAILRGDPLFGCPPAMQTIWDEQTRAGSAPALLSRMERAILADWRTADANEIAALPDVSEGLENRLIDAAKQADSLSAFYDLAKTKRYTHARIRRIVLSRFLRIIAFDISQNVPYIRVLAVGKNGKELLRMAKQTCSVPILTRSADIRNLDADAKRVLDMEFRAGELYALLLPKPAPSGAELQTPVFILS